MSATYYWFRPRELDPKSFRAWLSDCRKIILNESEHPGAPGVMIRGPTGVGEPVLTESEVAFNGDATSGVHFEPFVVPRVLEKSPRDRTDDDGRVFRFCKVAGRPYDKVVARCLAAFELRFGPTVRVEADAAAAHQLDAARKIMAQSTRLDGGKALP